ncbi:MAG: hypothetical protein ACE5F6_10050 [Anaerolineae bacterium]
MGKGESPTHTETIPPLLGRALLLQLRPASRLTWVGAGWAAVCGSVAAGALDISLHTLVQLGLMVVLVDPVLGAVWTALPGLGKPSLVRQSDGDHPHLTTTYRRQLTEIGVLYALALLLGVTLGPGVAVVVAVGLFLPLVVWFAAGGYPLRDGWTRAVLEIGVPWTIGLAAFASLPEVNLGGLSGLALSAVYWTGEHALALLVGLLFVVAYYGQLTLDQPLVFVRHRAVVTLPQLAAVVLLVAWHEPILAGAVAILVLAQMLFQPYLGRHRIRWYLRTTQWMFLGAMLLTAIGVAPWGQ